MKTEEFFDFGSKLVSSTFQAHAVGLKKDYKGINEEWNLIKGNYETIEFPIVFRQEYGRNLTDILDTGWPSLYLISDRLRFILEKNDLTGWKIFPITLYDKNGKEIFGYSGFSIIGQCGPTRYDKSEIIEIRKVPNGPICRYYRGVFIDDWDGSDFFTPEGTYETFITGNAAEILKRNKITNLHVVKLTDSQIPVRYVDTDFNDL